MTALLAPNQPFKAMAAIRTMSVTEYEKLTELGHLTKADQVELLEGFVVHKMPINPPHEFSTNALFRRLDRLLVGWTVRCQTSIRLPESKPEPDVSVARGDERDYASRSPSSSDLGLVIEVADSSLDRDQRDKARIYARDKIPVYWVVNLVDRRVEVNTNPNGPGDDPRYHTLRVFPEGTVVPVELDGVSVGDISVDDILP